MLRGNLYELVRSDGDGTFEVRLRTESPVYQAHFPGYPITPGVCILQIALELIGEMTGAGTPGLAAARNIKFMSPVIPDGETPLRFHLSGTGDLWSVDVVYGSTPCAKMSLTAE